MNFSEKNLNQVSDNLLSFLKVQLGDKQVGYEVFPSKIHVGNETSIFQFQLKSVHPSLSVPLVLRVFDKLDRPKHAIMESTIHNSLVDQGFPVPYVYYACIDLKYLGYQFLIMDFLPGALLPSVFGHSTNIILGKTHAMLHNADPSQLNKDLIAEGFGGRQYSFEGGLDRLLEASDRFPWLVEIVKWLIENRPSECIHPSICHGDFHPYNLLAKDGKVSAILDWSCCRIRDPAMDVASTLVIDKAATKHVVPSFDPKIETRKYLEAYKRERELDERYLEYYQVWYCTHFLLSGVKGMSIWTQPPIQNELINIIYDFSKIHVEVPR